MTKISMKYKDIGIEVESENTLDIITKYTSDIFKQLFNLKLEEEASKKEEDIEEEAVEQPQPESVQERLQQIQQQREVNTQPEPDLDSNIEFSNLMREIKKPEPVIVQKKGIIQKITGKKPQPKNIG